MDTVVMVMMMMRVMGTPVVSKVNAGMRPGVDGSRFTATRRCCS